MLCVDNLTFLKNYNEFLGHVTVLVSWIWGSFDVGLVDETFDAFFYHGNGRCKSGLWLTQNLKKIKNK